MSATVVIPTPVMTPTSVVIPAAPGTFVVIPLVIETVSIKISPVVSFEIRPVVAEIYAVAVVSIPGRIVIIGISRILGFTRGRRRIIATVIFLGGSGCIGVAVFYGSRSSDNHPGTRDMETEAGANINLGITFCGDEACGYNGGEHKYLFHICSFKFSDADYRICILVYWIWKKVKDLKGYC